MAQIFVSYARDDDLAPPGREGAKGFVTYLDEQLRYELKNLGGRAPRLWRDTRGIERAHQFEPAIETAIAEASLFVAVLSPNWLVRDWCARELETFRRRWSGEGDEEFKKRIVVVWKHRVAETDVPPLLRGQEGFRFFELDSESHTGQEHEFFARGRILDPRYETRVGELARYLWNAAAELEGREAAPEPLSIVEVPSDDRSAQRRTVFLAKPAADMRLAYDRLVKELEGAGYAVVPPSGIDIPHDCLAGGFIDEALAAAEVSVHPLGNKLGYVPEDSEQPIVKLQLARAAARAAAGKFRRLIWAPRFVQSADPASLTEERDPLLVLSQLDRQLEIDTIVGDDLSRFAEFLIQHLDRLARPAEAPETVSDGAQVYIYHRPEDENYAVDLALALRRRDLKPVLPAVEGDAAELEEFHRDNLRQCEAVVLCWANASEVWARATCRELRDWKRLGRAARFAVRGLVAGPPPGSRKSVLVRLPPEDEIDIVLDLTAHQTPPAEALDPLIRATRPSPQ